MGSFIENLILFSPLLICAGIALWLLERREKLRQAAGLSDAAPPDPELEPLEPPESEAEGDEREHVVDGQDAQLDEGETDGDESEPEAGPAEQPAGAATGAQQELRMPRTRNVGAKKARSLARRDQRRAYHDFLQSQREQRQETEAALREGEEVKAYENARARAVAEEEIAARKAAERKAKAEKEAREKEVEREDVQTVRNYCASRKCAELATLQDMVKRGPEWVERVLKREGFLGLQDDTYGMVTKKGWWVKVGPDELAAVWAQLEEKGKMDWKEIGAVLEEAISAAPIRS